MESKEGGPSQTALGIKKTLRWLIVATVVLYLADGVLSFFIWSQSSRNTAALCALRNDAQTRLSQSTQFLIDNPTGASGISVKVIQQGIDNAQRTVNSLSNLHCPPIKVLENPNPKK